MGILGYSYKKMRNDTKSPPRAQSPPNDDILEQLNETGSGEDIPHLKKPFYGKRKRPKTNQEYGYVQTVPAEKKRSILSPGRMRKERSPTPQDKDIVNIPIVPMSGEVQAPVPGRKVYQLNNIGKSILAANDRETKKQNALEVETQQQIKFIRGQNQLLLTLFVNSFSLDGQTIGFAKF